MKKLKYSFVLKSMFKVKWTYFLIVSFMSVVVMDGLTKEETGAHIVASAMGLGLMILMIAGISWFEYNKEVEE